MIRNPDPLIDLLSIGLVLGGGYLAYKFYTEQQAKPPTTSPPVGDAKDYFTVYLVQVGVISADFADLLIGMEHQGPGGEDKPYSIKVEISRSAPLGRRQIGWSQTKLLWYENDTEYRYYVEWWDLTRVPVTAEGFSGNWDVIVEFNRSDQPSPKVVSFPNAVQY